MSAKSQTNIYLAALISEWGYLMPTAGIKQALGFHSSGAFNNAMVKKTIPVEVFRLPGRKGYFARTHDVASWLEMCSRNNVEFGSNSLISKDTE